MHLCLYVSMYVCTYVRVCNIAYAYSIAHASKQERALSMQPSRFSSAPRPPCHSGTPARARACEHARAREHACAHERARPRACPRGTIPSQPTAIRRGRSSPRAKSARRRPHTIFDVRGLMMERAPPCLRLVWSIGERNPRFQSPVSEAKEIDAAPFPGPKRVRRWPSAP